MNREELDELIHDCPTLYHATGEGGWRSIAKHGLLSTTALLDLYELPKPQRDKIEGERRPSEVSISHPNLPTCTIRDQLPMDDAGLRKCLPPHLSPNDWYRLLNTKVFFWLTFDRLKRLLGAEAYQLKMHDIIEVDTRSIIKAYHSQIWLCPINSGYTKYVPEQRDASTFKRIADYPYDAWKTKRKKGERVVELAIDYAVPDIMKYAKRVVTMDSSAEEREVLFFPSARDK